MSVISVPLEPAATEFARLCRTANVVPVHREILADLDTPVSAYRKVAAGKPHSFLLESLEGGEKWARFSFIGTDPRLVFTSRGRSVMVRDRHSVERFEAEDPTESLRAFLARFRPAEVAGLPRLWAGAVGYISYDMVRFMERLPDSNPDDLGCPDCVMVVPETLLVFDNLRQTARVIRNVFPSEGDDPAALYAAAHEALDATVARLRGPLPHPAAGPPPEVSNRLTSNTTPERFREMVEAAKRYIREGDAIQIVLSQRFESRYDGDPFDAYRALRLINPSPYMFYLDFGPQKLVGSSPEVMVRLEGEMVELRPIAGTRRRGRDEQEDLAMERELTTDPKEAAEHIMLVDLGRNDVGRVSRYGTVEVNELMVVERYSHVMHIVSNVRGQILPGKDAMDVLRACFPAGTVSGAPKVRAMEIIEELEPCRRGVYAGAVGYFNFSGNMDLGITIRTLMFRNGQVYLQAGAGIVADSDPEMEYKETINKAKGMMAALEVAAGLRGNEVGPLEGSKT
ncbi:MAG: anthranilate synthase component I [Pseudomonadota bacterium]